MRTRGQPAALAATRALLASGFPHAALLTGPPGTGKTTLALDIAAALLCTTPDPADRPCRTCRACRMVEHGNHPDVHRLSPSGAGASISIGGRGERGVRDLVAELALLPVEGGARIAIVEAAQRMSEDAQSALLKTLEEPPTNTTLLLCVDDEERLLPTIRSRCVRIRLGPVPIRDVETILEERGVADAPTAARLARITEGRPGHAIAYALAPAAGIIRAEIARTLLDLLESGLTARLTGVRQAAARAGALARELDDGLARASLAMDSNPIGLGGRGRTGSRQRGGRRGPASDSRPVPAGAPAVSKSDPLPPGDSEAGTTGGGELDSPTGDGGSTRTPAAERRRAALVLLAIWRSVVRSLALAAEGALGSVRDVDLLDDLEPGVARLPGGRAGALLRELDVAGERLEGNVSPELVLDVLALRWTAGRPMA